MLRRKHFFFLTVILIAVLLVFVSQVPGRTFSFVRREASLSNPALQQEMVPQRDQGGVGAVRDGTCPDQNATRPFAVMLAGDVVARPLSGIAQADIVFEMPVITQSINRFMAVYACAGDTARSVSRQGELGSVRSARDDFLPLAASVDAIFVHWGGSHFALDALSRGALENLDALVNPGGAFFRKKGIGAPHNGFTTLQRLRAVAEKLHYRLTLREMTPVYARKALVGDVAALPTAQRVSIAYPGPYRVEWRFQSVEQSYLRFRGGTPEQDRDTGAQVAAGTVVVMRTTIRQVEGQYNDVHVTGSGEATVFRNGVAIEGTWEKAADPSEAPLRFLDTEGTEIPFAPGAVWIELIQKGTIVEAKP